MKKKNTAIIATLVGIIIVLCVVIIALVVLNVKGRSEENKKAEDATETQVVTVTEATTEEEKDTDGVIRPVSPLKSAEEALEDGEYRVAFTGNDLKQTADGYELNVEVFEYDRYDSKDIENLAVGDKIQFNNEEVLVESVEKNEETGYILINGGLDKNGFELTQEERLYRTVIWNDYPVYYSVGKISIPLSEESTFEDFAEAHNNPDGEKFGYSELPKALQNATSSSDFIPNNTSITVTGKKIVNITRHWIP